MASFNVSPSSSSFVPTMGRKYDVFLSFRGEDTRYTFVDHLYEALAQRGLWVFKDDKMLSNGKEIFPELLKTIEESRFVVVIFSANYADSSWCLAELANIMECRERIGLEVIPVFYHVDPSDVRGQKNEFAVAFHKQEKKFRGEMYKVNEWRKALTLAANISGHHCSKTKNEGEATIINNIVEDILAGIRPCYIYNDLIGIESHIDELLSLLATEEGKGSEVRKIGIYGMGGIGKTTIAQALFERIANKFEGSSFVNDVRENSSTKRCICALQEKMLKDVLKTKKKFIFRDPRDGANMIRTRFCRKSVLLVLDDVNNDKQLEFLANSHEWFGPGSIIIITTRDEHLLWDANAKYKPDLLQEDQAFELFSRQAFKKNSPSEGYEEMSCRAIRYAGYLPLAVKVLGSFFCGREVRVWESAFNRLAKAPNKDIFETLKLSFDGLEDSEKKIFLDIACFFKGKYEDKVTRVLDSFNLDAVIGISVLVEKSLITNSCGYIGMHDLIQEMGWQVVRESFPNSRIWKPEQIYDVKELEAIEAIVMPDNGYDANEIEENEGFSADAFERMKNLRLLDVNGKFTSCEPTFLPDDLRWLRWSRYPFSSLSVACMSKLVGLEVLGGNVAQFWNGQKVMTNLKFVKLDRLDSLIRFPDVSGALNIEILDLYYCQNMVEVDESLGSHKRLVELKMTGCKRLKHLPSMIEMESLKKVDLNFCSSLERFPDASGAPNIEKLDLYYCENLIEVHESLGSLKRLVYLNMSGCKRLKHLPHMIEMESLEQLSLSNCFSLERLPNVSTLMVNLSLIYLSNSHHLFAFSSVFRSVDWRLENLESLLCSFYKLQELPEKIESMENMKLLPSSRVPPAVSIALHPLTNLCSLTQLDLSGRQMEEEDFPKDLHSLSSLQVLNLSDNNKLTQLPSSISHLSSLIWLGLNNCHQLQNLHGLPSSLEILEANDCSSLEKIEDLSIRCDKLYAPSFVNCRKLLEDQQNERYLHKILESFPKRHRATIFDMKFNMYIPGSKIPSWFKEVEDDCRIALKIPPIDNNQIIGIAICAVFPGGSGRYKHWTVFIRWQFEKDGEFIGKKEFGCINASPAAKKGNIVWIHYEDIRNNLRFLGEDRVSGTLFIAPSTQFEDEKPIRCAARLVYGEDVDSIRP